MRLARCGHINFFFHRCHWSNEYSSSFADTINVTRQLSVELQLSSDGSRVGDTQRAGDKFDLLICIFMFNMNQRAQKLVALLHVHYTCILIARFVQDDYRIRPKWLIYIIPKIPLC